MADNFVLPETEKALNLIISKIKRSFEVSSLCFSGFYAVYTVFRMIFKPNYLIPNIILSVVSWAIFVMTLVEFIRKIHFKRALHLTFGFIRRAVCIFIFLLVFISLFSSYNEMLPYKVLITMFCGVGLIISIIGDIFNATIPVWIQLVLNAFKADIEISGLAERSLDQLKAELKKDGFKKKLTSGAIQTGGSIIRNAFKNIFKGKSKRDDD